MVFARWQVRLAMASEWIDRRQRHPKICCADCHAQMSDVLLQRCVAHSKPWRFVFCQPAESYEVCDGGKMLPSAQSAQFATPEPPQAIRRRKRGAGAGCVGRAVDCVLHTGYGQLAVVSYASFANIGVWNALNTIGGIGTGDTSISHTSMTIMHGTSLVAGFFAGSAVNYFGLRSAAVGGSCVLSIFLSTVFCVHFYTLAHSVYLLIAASLLCGSLIGWLLAAAGSISVHYATENQRSIFLAVGSVVLNLGGLLGSVLSLGLSINLPTEDSGATSGLSKTNYIVLLCLLYTGIPVSMLLRKPEHVIRSDGSPAPDVVETTLGEEWRGILVGMRELYLWLMFPMFMCSIWHEVTLFNYFNIQFFNVRSRAMNSVYYYAGRILASFPFQLACDLPKKLPDRILAGNGFTLVLCSAAFVTAILALTNAYNVRGSSTTLDFTEGRSSFLAICFFFYGSLETVATSFSLWLIGSLPFSDTAMTNRYVGLYRVGASLGGVLSWIVDSSSIFHCEAEWGISAALWCVAMICILYLQWDLRRKLPEGSLKSVSLDMAPTTTSTPVYAAV